MRVKIGASTLLEEVSYSSDMINRIPVIQNIRELNIENRKCLFVKEKCEVRTLPNSLGGTMLPNANQPRCSWLYTSVIRPCFCDRICLTAIMQIGSM